VRAGDYGGSSTVVIPFFANKSLTKTDRCTGALSLRRNLLLVLHFSRHFLLTASLRQFRMSMYISALIVPIPVNYTNDFQELFEATLYVLDADNWYYQIIMHYR
jgi:hypothetical protein